MNENLELLIIQWAIINGHFKDDYCLHYFGDNIGYDHNPGHFSNLLFLIQWDKHLNSE